MTVAATFLERTATDADAQSQAAAGTGVPGTQDDPSVPHPTYNRLKHLWVKCRALFGGTDEIRAGRETYLPRFANESDESYEFRLELVALTNAYARTAIACVGLLLQQEPKLGDDMPPALVALAENVDAAGTHLTVFSWWLFLDYLIDGYAGVLVEYPHVENPDQVSADDEARIGLRPYFIRIQRADVFLPFYETVNGKKTLTLLVLRETFEEKVGRFGIRTASRYRVYVRTGNVVTAQVWRKKEGEDKVTPDGEPQIVRNARRILFATLGEFAGKPPLNDLADLNLEHHQLKTNLRNLESLACVPTQVRIGAPRDANGNYPPITLGPRSTIEAPATEGVSKPIYWHSPDVSVLEPGTHSLADVKADMGAAGLAFLAPETRAAETAEAKRLDATAQQASLATTGRLGQDTLETAFAMAAELLSPEGRESVKAGSVTINTDFENTVMTPEMITALGALAVNGKLSIETLLGLLERGKVLEDGFSVVDEVRRILKEGALPNEPNDGKADPKTEPLQDPAAGSRGSRVTTDE